MLPVRSPRPVFPLKKVMELPLGPHPVRLRAVMLDGSEMEGDLVAVAPEHLSLLSASEQLQFVPADQIQAMYLGKRRPFRELLVVAGVTCGAAGVLTGMAQVPFLRQHLSWVAIQLCLFVIAGLGIARKRTSLGNWLTAWTRLVD